MSIRHHNLDGLLAALGAGASRRPHPTLPRKRGRVGWGKGGRDARAPREGESDFSPNETFNAAANMAVTTLRPELKIDSHPQLPSITPLRRPLGKKGPDAFLGVGVEQVFHHDAGGVLVGIRQAHRQLRVERLLAEANRMRRF